MAVAGKTVTSMPRAAIRYGVRALMPRSRAATRNRGSPSTPTDAGDTVYGSCVLTFGARFAPTMPGLARIRSQQAGLAGFVGGRGAIAPRIAPRSRRCRVSARVSMPDSPTMPCARSSSSSVRWDRQLLGMRLGSRTT